MRRGAWQRGACLMRLRDADEEADPVLIVEEVLAGYDLKEQAAQGPDV